MPRTVRSYFKRSFIFSFSFLFLFSSLFFSCSSKKKQDPQHQFSDVEGLDVTEAKYGNKIYLDVVSTGIICQDAKINEYVSKLRERLIQNVEIRSFHYLVTVTNERRVYAASTPGGYVYLSLGMIEYVNSESELAAAIAHEIAETQYKQQQFRLSKQTFKLGRSLTGFLNFLMPLGIAVNQGAKMMDHMVLKDKSLWDMLMTADTLAVQYLDAGGFRPHGFLELAKSFIEYPGPEYDLLKTYLITRPFTEKRVIKLKEMVEEYPENLELRTREINSYYQVKKHVRNLIYQLPSK